MFLLGAHVWTTGQRRRGDKDLVLASRIELCRHSCHGVSAQDRQNVSTQSSVPNSVARVGHESSCPTRSGPARAAARPGILLLLMGPHSDPDEVRFRHRWPDTERNTEEASEEDLEKISEARGSGAFTKYKPGPSRREDRGRPQTIGVPPNRRDCWSLWEQCLQNVRKCIPKKTPSLGDNFRQPLGARAVRDAKDCEETRRRCLKALDFRRPTYLPSTPYWPGVRF